MWVFLLVFILSISCQKQREIKDAGLDEARIEDSQRPEPPDGVYASFPPLAIEESSEDGGIKAFSNMVGKPCKETRDCGKREEWFCISDGYPNFWPDGYCIKFCNIEAEDPEDPEVCPPGTGCYVRISGAPGGGGCLKKCNYNLDTNGGCRAGYRCYHFPELCIPGCVAQDDPRDYSAIHSRKCCTRCAEVSPRGRCTNYIDLYECNNLCDNITWRCINEGTIGAEIGGACRHSSMCPEKAICYAELFDPSLKGGYCSMLRCDLPDITCPEGSICQNLYWVKNKKYEFAYGRCVKSCKIGDPGNGEEESECRKGYACHPYVNNQETGEFIGVCWYGNFNEIKEPNIGADCVDKRDPNDPDDDLLDDSRCYSPKGLGVCIGNRAIEETKTVAFKDGYCSIYCGYQQDPIEVEDPKAWKYPDSLGVDCPSGSVCLRSWFWAGMFCMKTCDPKKDECQKDEICYPGELLNIKEKGVCLHRCKGDADCPKDRKCEDELCKPKEE